MNRNPFDPQFGQVPQLFLDYDRRARNMVSRMKLAPNGQSWFITGVRGSGKTVLMNYFGNLIKQEPGYFVVRTDNDDDLFGTLYRNLIPVVNGWHLDSVSLGGFHFSHDKPTSEGDYAAVLTSFFETLKKTTSYHIVILLDEARKSPYMKRFANKFRNWNGDDLPVHVVMTGLLKEVSDLAMDDNLSFLLRSTKFIMKPLLPDSINDVYIKCFHDKTIARQMTLMTRGYAFAFQLLGYEMWEASQNNLPERALEIATKKYKARLFDQAYLENIKPFRQGTIDYLKAIEPCHGQTGKVAKSLGLSLQSANNIRVRLIKYGLLYPPKRGFVAFTLPYFADFIKAPDQYSLDQMVYVWDDQSF